MAFTGQYQQVTEGEVFKYLTSTQELCFKISVLKNYEPQKIH